MEKMEKKLEIPDTQFINETVDKVCQLADEIKDHPGNKEWEGTLAALNSLKKDVETALKATVTFRDDTVERVVGFQGKMFEHLNALEKKTAHKFVEEIHGLIQTAEDQIDSLGLSLDKVKKKILDFKAGNNERSE